MSEPLTDAEIAELRRMLTVEPGPYHEAIDGPIHAACWRATPRLLDEVERARGLLAEFPPVPRGDYVSIPREQYERLRRMTDIP